MVLGSRLFGPAASVLFFRFNAAFFGVVDFVCNDGIDPCLSFTGVFISTRLYVSLGCNLSEMHSGVLSVLCAVVRVRIWAVFTGALRPLSLSVLYRFIWGGFWPVVCFGFFITVHRGSGYTFTT